MTDLSPAARAVLDAYDVSSDGHYDDGVWVPHIPKQLAAALRAAAECSCEEQDTPPETLYEQGYLDALERVFKRMNAIAADLEGANVTNTILEKKEEPQDDKDLKIKELEEELKKYKDIGNKITGLTPDELAQDPPTAP